MFDPVATAHVTIDLPVEMWAGLEHFTSLLEPESFSVFFGEVQQDGEVPVLVTHNDGTIWSLLLAPTGDVSSSSAKVGEWTTGVEA